MHFNITVLDNRLHDFVDVNAPLENPASDCSFAEGSVWNRDGFYLFSDIPQNAIYKIEGGKKTLFVDKSGCKYAHPFLSEQVGSNGLTYNTQGELIICQHGDGAIASYSGDGYEVHALLAGYEGKRFNSPNDVVVRKDGSLFFSDPPYGLKDQQLNAALAQSKAAVYCYRNEEVLVVSEAYQYPNGVCLSADGRKLYICSNKPFERFVLEFDASTLALLRTVAIENGDGIKSDPYQNLYLCAKEGIVIIDNAGQRLGVISLPAIPANCCWGGHDGNDLFITAREHIFLLRNFLR